MSRGLLGLVATSKIAVQLPEINDPASFPMAGREVFPNMAELDQN